MEIPKHITFLTSYGNYKAGDGLQMESTPAAALVAAGIASYSENYVAPESPADIEYSSLQAQIDAAVLLIVDLTSRVEALEE